LTILNLKQYAICERAIEKPQIWSAGKDKRLEKSQFVEDVGDVGYGVGSVFG
jgi:hypothetical protein